MIYDKGGVRNSIVETKTKNKHEVFSIPKIIQTDFTSFYPHV